MVAGKGLFYPILGFASFVAFIYFSFGDLWINYRYGPQLRFVQRNGTHFMVDGTVFYINGWNSYWLMDHAVDYYSRPRVREMLKAGAKMGLTVCRTWAFNDGAYNALQISPGRYDERVFRVRGIQYLFALTFLIIKHFFCQPYSVIFSLRKEI